MHRGNLKLIRYLVLDEKVPVFAASLADTEKGQEAPNFAVTAGHLELAKCLAENGVENMLDEEHDRKPVWKVTLTLLEKKAHRGARHLHQSTNPKTLPPLRPGSVPRYALQKVYSAL